MKHLLLRQHFQCLYSSRLVLHRIPVILQIARVHVQSAAQQHLRSSAYNRLARKSIDQSAKAKKNSSLSPYLVLFALITSSAVIVDYVTASQPDTGAEVPADQKGAQVKEPASTRIDPSVIFAAMPIPPGSLGNLTAEQEQKLKEFWAITLKTFGVKDPLDADAAGRPITPADAAPVADQDSGKKKERHGLFHRSKKDSVSATSPRHSASDPEDKYGQTKELQDILATSSADDLREAFWSMVKKDHPDALLLRFLRARKWDVQRALAMLISTMHWRRNEMHVDDDIMKMGEGGALIDSQGSDASTKREGTDFLAQLRMGKSFIHGVDKEGRPICFVRARLHRGGEQTERALERYTVYLIETCRLALTPPVETATIVFDMTGFTMANMDYAPVKFMIKVFEANYPESLGSVLVHKAPWIFQGIWKIIRGWLDPVVAAKVHFTNGVEDLQEFIPKSQIIKELGGEEDWEYKYVEPVADENAAMQNDSLRKELESARREEVLEYEKKTFEWIHGEDTKADRDNIAKGLKTNYWQLDPLIRARSLYDRTGMIGKDGSLNYYPTQTVKTENLPAVNGPAKQEASADDVD